MNVTLSPSELLMAGHAGLMRGVENRKPAYGAGHGNEWQLNVSGAIGEMVVAKVLGLYWSGKGTFRGADVGTLQVRSTDKDNGCLLLHEADEDDAQYWLVVGRGLTYRVAGYILGKDGKNEKYWGDPFKTGRPCFWVPQTDLRKP